MHKKDYELIAEAIALIYHRYPYWNATRDEMVEEIANALESDNPEKFDRNRFYIACGMLEEVSA